MEQLERFIAGMQIEVRRAAANDDKPTIQGHAIVFNSLSEDLGGFREQIAPGAFGDLKGKDIRAFWNHDPGIVLGRTKAGTLEVEEDRKGVHVVIHPPASAAGQVESIERGDVDQMSFGFRVQKDDWQRVDGGKYVRTILQASLIEVSPVAIPAYPQTTVGLRALFGAPDIPESLRRAPLEKQESSNRRAPGAADPKGSKAKMGDGTMDKTTPVDLRRKAQGFIDRAGTLDALVNEEKRTMTEDERGEYDNALAEHRRLSEAADRAEQLQVALAPEEGDEDDEGDGGEEGESKAAARQGSSWERRNINLKRGKRFQEERAIGSYIREGAPNGLMQLRASNPGPMTTISGAVGGFAVPTAHYQQIIARRGEYMLADKLGVRRIPGRGNPMNVPVEVAHDEPFVLTPENTTKDKDIPTLGQVVMTLKTYSKVVPLTEELLADEDSNLVAFVEDWIGRQMALTHNNLLVGAALSTGTPAGGTIVALPPGVTAAPADITTLYYSLKEPYADNGKWLMRRLTQGAYGSIQGDAFVFNNTPQGNGDGFWGAPVFNSQYVPALAASAKALIFGDWYYMGLRESPSFNFLRDPYSESDKDIVKLRYFFRAVYAVLQPEAILIGQKAAT